MGVIRHRSISRVGDRRLQIGEGLFVAFQLRQHASQSQVRLDEMRIGGERFSQQRFGATQMRLRRRHATNDQAVWQRRHADVVLNPRRAERFLQARLAVEHERIVWDHELGPLEMPDRIGVAPLFGEIGADRAVPLGDERIAPGRRRQRLEQAHRVLPVRVGALKAFNASVETLHVDARLGSSVARPSADVAAAEPVRRRQPEPLPGWRHRCAGSRRACESDRSRHGAGDPSCAP